MIFQELMKVDSLQYQILEMRMKYNMSYHEIAKKLNKSHILIRKQYRMICACIFKSYSQYLQELGVLKDTTYLMDFYKSYPHAIAYLENNYADILSSYRSGTPSLFSDTIVNLPVYRILSKDQMATLENRIIHAREKEKKSFISIGNEYNITRNKAKHIYESYYHRKVLHELSMMDANKTKEYLDFIMKYSSYPHKRWIKMVQDDPSLLTKKEH